MDITLMFVLLPGILAYGVSRSLCGARNVPITEIIVSLALHSACVVMFYSMISYLDFFELLNPVQLVAVFANLKNQESAAQLKALVENYDADLAHAFFVVFFSAVLVGLMSAVEKDKRYFRKISKIDNFFQTSEVDSVWKDMVEIASPSCWMQFDTKDGRCLTGSVSKTSLDYKDGGVGLNNVHQLQEDLKTFEKAADYLFVPTTEIVGPIFYVEPILTSTLTTGDKGDKSEAAKTADT